MRASTVVLYIDSVVVAGAERAVLHLLAGYAGTSDLVVCATSEVVLDAAAAVAPEVRRELVPVAGSFVRSIAAHRAAFDRLRPDLVHITLSSPFAGRPALLAAWSLGLPTVIVEQLVLAPRRRRGRWLKRAFTAPVARVVAVGQASAVELDRLFGIPMRMVTVIHNGIPDEPLAAVAVRDRRPVVGSAARLEDQKQLDVLVDAMAEVGDAELVIVGDGSRRSDLIARAERLGIDARFVGWVPDARGWIAGFDVFALPSREEAFPLTIVEAMLSGTAVVATDVGSVSEAVRHEETGLLVEPGDRDGLAMAIRRLLDDEALRERITAAAGRLARERFTARRMADAYGRVWDEVLAHPPKWCRPVRALTRRRMGDGVG